ncbi:MAG: hypothetical protein IEMM0002_1562 [bacterium]|nr:MAG: hypothetical protein IEMM0002_1562 [bacterium]
MHMHKIFTFFFFLLLTGFIAFTFPQTADAMGSGCSISHGHGCNGSGGMMNHPEFSNHCDHSGGAAVYPGAQNCCGELASVKNNPSSPSSAQTDGSGRPVVSVSTKPRSVNESSH